MLFESLNYEEAQMVHKAILFAEKAHRGQKCSGSSAAFIIHPMEVLQILEAVQAPAEVKLAGILHECLAKTDVTYEDLELEFGKEVADIVSACTIDEGSSWYETKSLEIENAENIGFYEKLVIMADVISNMRQLRDNLMNQGDDFWDVLPVKKDDVEWYYSKIQDALYELSEVEEVRTVYWEMVDLFKEMFVRFFQVDDTYLLQATESEVHMFNPKDMEWYDVSDQISMSELANIDGCREIDQELAEQLEDILVVGVNVKKQTMFANYEDLGHN